MTDLLAYLTSTAWRVGLAGGVLALGLLFAGFVLGLVVAARRKRRAIVVHMWSPHFKPDRNFLN